MSGFFHQKKEIEGAALTNKKKTNNFLDHPKDPVYPEFIIHLISIRLIRSSGT